MSVLDEASKGSRKSYESKTSCICQVPFATIEISFLAQDMFLVNNPIIYNLHSGAVPMEVVFALGLLLLPRPC